MRREDAKMDLYWDRISMNVSSIGIYPDQMLTNGGVICGCAQHECDYMRSMRVAKHEY